MFSFTGLSVGGFDATNRVSTQVDVFVPGQTCTKTISPMPWPITRIYLTYLNSKLWACGEYFAQYICFGYTFGATNAWDANFVPIDSHIGYNAIDDGSKIWVMSDNKPQVFNPAAGTWAYWTVTPSLLTANRTNGGSCLVFASLTIGGNTIQYIYSFGGDWTRAVQRFAINPIGTKWEYMTDLPGDGTQQSCALYAPNTNMVKLQIHIFMIQKIGDFY